MSRFSSADIATSRRELKIPDANRGVGVQTENFEKRECDSGRCGDHCSADDRELARIHISAPNGESAGNDSSNAQHKAEKHDDRQTVTDTGFELRRTEFNARSKRSEGIQNESCRKDGDPPEPME